MFQRLFLDHPRSVGETYLEHQSAALGFAGPLYVAAFAATLHALIPGLCQKTGSRIILGLHARLHRGHGRGAATDAEYVI